MNSVRKHYFSLLLFLVLVFLVEWLGHVFTFSSVLDWYPTLSKPSWTPPTWVFGPTWTVLYLMMGIAGWLVFIRPSARIYPTKRNSFVIYGLQLLCNLLWSYFFFFLKDPGLALLDITALVILIGMNIFAFEKIYRPAAFLLIPYFLWSLYAATLNAAIWSLNR